MLISSSSSIRDRGDGGPGSGSVGTKIHVCDPFERYIVWIEADSRRSYGQHLLEHRFSVEIVISNECHTEIYS